MKQIPLVVFFLVASSPRFPNAVTPPSLPLPAPTPLGVRAVRDNATFAEWRAALGREPSASDLNSLLDLLDAARSRSPGMYTAMFGDAEFRRRALREPSVRGKAVELFQLPIPYESGLPTIDQLMHARPNDDCPTCRLRAQMAIPTEVAP